jgi:hypothetical protein
VGGRGSARRLLIMFMRCGVIIFLPCNQINNKQGQEGILFIISIRR